MRTTLCLFLLLGAGLAGAGAAAPAQEPKNEGPLEQIETALEMTRAGRLMEALEALSRAQALLRRMTGDLPAAEANYAAALALAQRQEADAERRAAEHAQLADEAAALQAEEQAVREELQHWRHQMQAFRQQAMEIEAHLAQLRQQYTAEHPKVRQAQEEQEVLKHHMADLENTMVRDEDRRDELRARSHQLQQKLHELAAESESVKDLQRMVHELATAGAVSATGREELHRHLQAAQREANEARDANRAAALALRALQGQDVPGPTAPRAPRPPRPPGPAAAPLAPVPSAPPAQPGTAAVRAPRAARALGAETNPFAQPVPAAPAPAPRADLGPVQEQLYELRAEVRHLHEDVREIRKLLQELLDQRKDAVIVRDFRAGPPSAAAR